MEIRTMTNEELEVRIAEIETAMTAEDADLDALSAEMTEIEARKAELATAEAARQAEARKIAEGTIPSKKIEERKENKTMTNMEIRNSAEYVRAFANYVRTGSDAECRALLTENATNGTVPVPEFVETIIHTAWQENEILNRVTKSYLKGNVKVGFEISATDAAIHPEGDPVTEESLVLGIASLVPQTIKKWISVSDEVLDLDDGDFLRYIYSEIAYKIADKLVGMIIAALLGQTTAGSASVPAGYTIANGTASTAQIVNARAYLSDEARDPVLLMDKATEAAIKASALSAGFGYDPFDGMRVYTHSALAGHIVLADLGSVQVNFPAGENVQFKFDELTLATSDLVRIIGRLPAAVAVVKPRQSVNVTLAS